MLVGENPAVRVNESTPPFDDNVRYANLLRQWKNWRVGFSHFVEMSETPTEDVLWKMLDRRAAASRLETREVPSLPSRYSTRLEMTMTPSK